jgi:hypothetical protein
MYGPALEERFADDKYQPMHMEMCPYHIIHAECLGGDIDLLQSTALLAARNRPAAPPPSAFRAAPGAFSFRHRVCWASPATRREPKKRPDQKAPGTSYHTWLLGRLPG